MKSAPEYSQAKGGQPAGGSSPLPRASEEGKSGAHSVARSRKAHLVVVW